MQQYVYAYVYIVCLYSTTKSRLKLCTNQCKCKKSKDNLNVKLWILIPNLFLLTLTPICTKKVYVYMQNVYPILYRKICLLDTSFFWLLVFCFMPLILIQKLKQIISKEFFTSKVSWCYFNQRWLNSILWIMVKSFVNIAQRWNLFWLHRWAMNLTEFVFKI